MSPLRLGNEVALKLLAQCFGGGGGVVLEVVAQPASRDNATLASLPESPWPWVSLNVHVLCIKTSGERLVKVLSSLLAVGV